MIIAVLGTPTALTFAGCAIVKTIVEVAGGPHNQIPTVFIDDLRTAWSNLQNDAKKKVVIVSDLPSTPLLSLIRSSRMPTIIFLDKFEEVVNQLVETRGMQLRQAVRHATKVFCLIDQVPDEAALRVSARDGRRSLKAFIASVCDFFGQDQTAEEARDVMTALGYAAGDSITLREHTMAKLPQLSSAESIAARSDAEGQAMLTLIAKQYAEVGTARSVAQIAWPTELFFQAHPPQDFLVGPTDLVGPARLLFYGPYLHLPKGSWIATITVEVAENFSGNYLYVDVFAGSVLAAGETPLPPSGVFGFDLQFEIIDPFLGVEVRSQILSGAIEGRLELREVVFRRKETRNS
jgi:hypothetical protein